MTKCPHCRTRLVQRSGDGHVRVRTQGVLIFKSTGGAYVVCRECKSEVAVDVGLGEGLQKALTRVEPRLVVRNVDGKAR